MNSNEAINQVETTFTKPFNEGIFRSFSKNLLKDLDESKEQTFSGAYIKDAFKPHVSSYKRLGSYLDANGETLDVLTVKLTDFRKLDSARTMQRNFVSDYLKTRGEKDSAIVAFYNEDYGDWRFSYVRMEYKIEMSDKGQIKVKEELTPARRYSFLVGENEPKHTAQQQIAPLLGSNKKLSLSEIEDAFNIESITKEFFNKYKDLFLKLKDEIDDILEKDGEITEDFEKHEISTANFAKKLMGQIVFLYFVQKKGWMGVSEDGKWGEGDKKFLQTLFGNCKSDGKNFFNDYLEPLFYDALNNEHRGTDKPDYHLLFKCRIPFLNGGLFEPMNDYDWENTELRIENDIFAEILNTFDLYNFTVREDEPLDKEVAVDPEMLGKVFENLLEVTDRKSKGAFYTPRKIVHYMCQESLVSYLYSNLNFGDNYNADSIIQEIAVPKNDIEEFIHNGSRYYDYAVAIRELGTKIYQKEKLQLPVAIRNNIIKIDQLLNDVKVCDPAIGSGAFPLGMLTEIVRARYTLSAYFADEDPDRTIYNFKRLCILESIYGVDIDPGAIDIAKLRLWLSLVVDEDDFNKIQPLPNLDYKIMQGNSLLEEYEGIKLFDEKITEVDDDSTVEEEIKILTNRQMDIQKIYIVLHSQGSLTDTQKQIFEKELKQIQRSLKQLYSPQQKNDNADSLGLFNKSEAKKKADRLNALHEIFFDATRKSQKEQIRKEIDDLEWELIEATLKEYDKLEALTNLTTLRKSNSKPFFLWKLHFSEVFKKNGGFDIVIGNPPYIQIQKFSGQQLQKDLEHANFKTFAKTGDIYSLFYEKGWQILNPNGHVCLITSNKWMRANYGKATRKFFAEKTNPIQIIDFGGYQVFESATVDTNILIFEKATNKQNCIACSIKKDFTPKTDISKYLAKNAVTLDNLSEDSWIISSQEEYRIKKKIEEVGTPLQDWDISINRGVLTGFNEAFIIDGQKKDELIAKDPKNVEIIKPILRGRDIKKYSANFADLWLIFIPWHFPLHKDSSISGNSAIAEKAFRNEYPDIYNHLLQHKERLSQRNQAETGIRYEWYALQRCAASYYEEFEKEKIVFTKASKKQAFALLSNDSFLLQTAYIATGKNLRFVLCCLNSHLVNFAFRNYYQGGGIEGEITVQSVVKIPIPEISKIQQKPFEELVDKIMLLTSSLDYQSNQEKQSKVKQYENKIDQMVYELYSLTAEEIAIVEDSIK